MHKVILLSILVCGLSIPAGAEEITAIKADRVDTITSGLIENGIIVIKDGRITAIGNDIEIPETAEIIDVSDKTIFPGLVNPSSRIGLSSPPGGGTSSKPHLRVADELYPHQDVYKHVLRRGFTTIGLVPGRGGGSGFIIFSGSMISFGSSGGGIAGQGAIIRPVGRKPEEMIVIKSGLLMINFQANDRTKNVIKSALDSAKSKTSSTDPKVQPLINALQGKIPTFINCEGPGDILHLLKLLEPYKQMKVVLNADSEQYRVADKLAKKKIPVILTPQIDFEPFTRNRINVPKMLADAGIKIAFMPKSDSIYAHEDFLREVAELVKAGLDKEIAKKAITINPAQMLAVDYRLGSLEVGKDANLLVLNGDLLDIGTKIEMVMIEGKVVHKAP
ncbi:MAG: amidohydrolase family protein [Phycisphaerae bacterium]|nr:amidohydrolase family protein [Phycisphaerae bacterium]NIR65058.1 amidohydrolase family protein [candidate division Zixibacteria bacterium]NIP56241.1 amidohydrolase family protein [Phycisphaerae bacterium]NIS54694.1 amidohydrolase family protein [Phycisphaerae bacterium]NIU12285.1 amidohydrolase family protein [Phycisphaerae bacterium]